MLHNAGHTCIDGASVLQRPISQFQQRTWLIDQQRHIGRSMDENTTADEAFQPLLPSPLLPEERPVPLPSASTMAAASAAVIPSQDDENSKSKSEVQPRDKY